MQIYWNNYLLTKKTPKRETDENILQFPLRKHVDSGDKWKNEVDNTLAESGKIQ